MPFKSESQRRFLWKNNPKMAKEWADHTPKGKKLPKKVSSRKRKTTAKKSSRKRNVH